MVVTLQASWQQCYGGHISSLEASVLIVTLQASRPQCHNGHTANLEASIMAFTLQASKQKYHVGHTANTDACVMVATLPAEITIVTVVTRSADAIVSGHTASLYHKYSSQGSECK